MRNLIEFLAKYNHWFLFVFLEVLCFVLLFRFNSYQSSIWFTSANKATASIDRLYAEAVHYLYLEVINTDLTQRNIVLQAENAHLRAAIQDLTPDTSYTARMIQQALHQYTLLPAVVTSATVRQGDNYLVIDQGRDSGVRPEMGVVCGAGVVGIVAHVGAQYSLVVPIINSQSSISCRVRGSQYFGYLKWQGGNPLVAQMTDIPRYANPQEGVVIETSGYSAVFPPGIFVGRALSIQNSKDGLSYTMRVNLGTDFRTLRNVSVVMTPYKAQVDSLLHTAITATQED